MLAIGSVSDVSAQTADTIRYVKTTENGGSYQGSGLSWDEAKNNLQAAINDLYQYLRSNENYSSGSIYVGAGTYRPSESTESSGSDLQYTSFKVYPGIHIYGGFKANESDMNARPYDENGNIDTHYRPLVSNMASLESGEPAKLQPWNFENKTILSGSQNADPSFTYDDIHGTYTTIFPGNSYHVVWFATEGFIPVAVQGDEKNHAIPLSQPAGVDGCTITGGNASGRNTNERLHTAYGGGAYMVANATLRSCVIYNCEATMRGGGVYLDGGGLVDKCMIHTCQASGVGIMQGYGGGVCIDYDGAVTRSYIVNNSSRIGGGVAICHAPTEYPWQSLDQLRVSRGEAARGEINVYSPHATACIITNNTTTSEGAGLFLYDGGVGNHLTITRNKCIGQDVTYYGRRHGRSGGVYVLNGGQMYNSVIWGNRCDANNDIQYATYIGGSTEDQKDEDGNIIKEGLRPTFYYSAVEQHDITDWAGTSKRSVMSLERTNTNTVSNNANYPYFIGSDGYGRMMGHVGAGLNTSLAMGTYDQDYADGTVDTPDRTKTGIPRPIYWKPAAISSMAKMGLQVSDALHLNSQWVMHAHTETDMYGDKYEPMATFGALVRREEQFGCAFINNQEIEQYRDKGYTQDNLAAYNEEVRSGGHNKTEEFLTTHLPDDGTRATLPTLFVDPARNAGEKGIVIGEQGVGSSWDKPVGSINDAIHYFRKHLKRDESGHIVYDANGDVTYIIPVPVRTGGTDEEPVYEDQDQEFKYVQILVKGYTRGSGINATTAGIDAYLGSQLRTAAIRPTSNMRIYGGYASDAGSTATDNRDANAHPTTITANITKSGYENNGAHVLALINVRNVIIDGLRLTDGNANLYDNHSYAPNGEPITYGGGIIVNNATVPAEERIDMTGNIYRNGYITNCSAPDGAAVYVNSSNKDGNGNYCRAELNIMNTIIRNNSVGDGTHDISAAGYGDAGVVSARGGKAKIRIDHCDIVNNCGYALETLEYSDKTTPGTTGEEELNDDEGQIRIYNSIIYANGKIDRANRSKIQQPLSCRSATGSLNNVDGDYIYLDWDAPKPKNPEHCFAILCRDFSDEYHKWAVRKMNTYQETVYDEVSPKFFDSEQDANDWVALHAAGAGESWSKKQGSSETGAILLDYPYFDNPSRNVGHSSDGDKPMNGGIVSYLPGNQNPIVNAACVNSDRLWDMNLQPRTRGGDPDIGAIEDTHLPLKGTVIYVTPDGAGRRDGSSWRNAIAGNTVYVLDEVAGPDLAAGDQLDIDAGGNSISDRVLDSEGNPILTSNPKYNGGFGKIWINSNVIHYHTSSSASYHDYITEKNVYNGGANDGLEESLPPRESTEAFGDGESTSVPAGFTPGYNYDPRYPYGELSGASRSFWRANPYHSGTDWNNGASYSNMNDFITACNTNGWINNTRAERYVGGLQYAVEKATAYNTLADDSPLRDAGIDAVQVWVGDGKYSDYKGFVMRDKTTVMGGFPASTLGSPGLSERQALMSDVVNIPKSKAAQDLDPKDYETILQISDTDPKTDNTTFNTAAVNFWDDDIDLVQDITISGEVVRDRQITHIYEWSDDDREVDVTTDYYLYSVFKDDEKTSESTEGDTHILTFGSASDNYDCWHLTYTGNASTTGSNGVIGRYEANQMSGGATNNNKDIYENGVSVGKTTSNRIWIRNGSLSGVNMWQNMKNVPAGDYKIVVDLTAYYRSGTTMQAGNVPTGVNFIVIGANGNTLVNQEINAKNKKGTSLKKNLERVELCRYTFNFTQPATGTLSVRIEIGELDPTKGNNREVSMENFKLIRKITGGHYYESNYTDIATPRNNSVGSSLILVTSTVKTHRTTLRKRVLSMPDVCVPTYGAGSVGDPSPSSDNRGKYSDQLSHTHRVTGATKSKRTSWENDSYVREDPNYVEYSNVFWNGFTIRHGFIADENMAHGGGAGANIYEGVHLQNCVVINNFSYCDRVKGGGVFCDGATSTIEGCFVLNNISTHGTNNVSATKHQIFAGGMFMYEGTCFNSLFANNYSYGSAGGIGFCVGRFYNNTIAYNTCDLKESNQYSGGAVSLATSSSPNLFVANSIIYGNNGIAIRDRNEGVEKVNPFINCYIQSEVTQPNKATKQNVTNWTESDKNNYGIGNKFLNGVSPSAETTPFAADFDENGVYVPGRAASLNDFRLNSRLNDCINKGTENFESNLHQALSYKKKSDADIQGMYIYQSVHEAQLPDNDVVFADRVMDCQIDMGAYEYDGTKEIHPGFELIPFDPEDKDSLTLCAVYYVSDTGEGLGSADSPANSACPEKLQKVLDAAARLKLDLQLIKDRSAEDKEAGIYPERYSTDAVHLIGPIKAKKEEVYFEGDERKVRQVLVPKDMSEVDLVVVKFTSGEYVPVRSTNNNMVKGNSEEVLPTRSINVPHGVELWGGYTNTGETAFYETYRDPLNNKTTFSGTVTNPKNGETGRAYHVVSFTNNIYDINDLLIEDKEGILRQITDRSVVDGISIENGMANGTDDSERIGGAAVVSAYGHIRNCIIQNNEATNFGGGLYLMPASLVSGSVILNNEAEYGGGVYVYEPTDEEYDFYAISDEMRNLSYARLYNSTVVRNHSSVNGGGVWYSTNIRAKGVVLWQNTSADMNNVAGVFDTEEKLLENNYPFSYSAVQSRRLPGVNNIEIKTENDKDVRFVSEITDDMRWRGDIAYYAGQTNQEAYYYIERLSALVRTGMPYNLYRSMRNMFPSLELRDMAGVARMRELFDSDDASATSGYLRHMTFTPEKKDNEFIEMGARAVNNAMAATVKRPFTRLYVANPELVDLVKANRLLNSGDPLYSQTGSSMANPFQRFSDAVDYIIMLRSNESVKEIYRDTRFEVFIAGGTYYPTHNARGEEGHARVSTFIVPEGVSIVGGLDPTKFYCQAGYHFDYMQPTAGQHRLNFVEGEAQTNVKESNDRATVYNEAGDDITETLKNEGLELVSSVTDDIWTDRPKEDINGNNIYEPWEFLYATTFSGETPRGIENTDNVYHVFTCFADSTRLGALPHRYTDYHPDDTNGLRYHKNEQLDYRHGTKDGRGESTMSEMHRMIIFNGVNIINGNARDYEPDAIVNHRNYYRGGGILVDGSWENGDLDSGQTRNEDGDTVDIEDEIDVTDPDAAGLRNIPLMLVGSQFLSNTAIQGGAIFTNGNINIFSCSFVQNYTEGPKSDKDKGQNIQYTGGGAIAVNGELRATNTIFANNEAMLGKWEDRIAAEAEGYKKQAFGGAIWGSHNSNVRFTNCDIVNNKAVSYPAVFVDHFEDQKKFSVNTIYWGNRASGSEETAETFVNGWENLQNEMDINRDVYSYRTQANKEQELELSALRASVGDAWETDEYKTQREELADYESHQIMFFCCYRPTFGPDPILTQGKVHVVASEIPRAAEFGISGEADYLPQELPFMGEDVNYFDLFKGNNNINITFENEGVDGPNFVLPSSKAGKDGYNPSANWMLSRINNLIDNGWSYLTLTSKTADMMTQFKKKGGDPETNEGGLYPWELYNGSPMMPDNNIGGGPYNFYAFYLRYQYGMTFMPIGEQFYMSFLNSRLTEGSEGSNNMLRISSNPILFNDEEKVYIDLGVYEYQHRSLRVNQTSEVDVLWVSENEDLDKGNDGYSWETPTSNLQAAIETLLRSRNNRAKQVNIIGGDYKPNALLGNDDDLSLSFTIQTRLMNNGALTPVTDKPFGIKSLTIRGGYDPKIPGEDGYNTEKNPVVFSLAKRISVKQEQLGHILNIIDAEQYETQIPQLGDVRNTATQKVVPIVVEGITFENKFADNTQAGSAIYYHKQTQYNEEEGRKSDLLLDSVGTAPKLTIRNCIFRGNGQEGNPSAVKVEEGGGRTLIVNSLFYNNEGKPYDGLNTTVLNSTFALNKGYLTIRDNNENDVEYHSSIHNSVVWRDDLAGTLLTDNAGMDNTHPQWSIKTATGTEYGVGTSDNITYNAYSLPDYEPETSMLPDNKQNIIISKTNENVMLGPNFADPLNGNFHLNPSQQLVNTGDNATYARIIWPDYTDENDYKALMQNNHIKQETYDTYTTTVRGDDGEPKEIQYTKLQEQRDYDLGMIARLQGTRIDRGAYECYSSGLRIIYVNPNNLAAPEDNTGLNWVQAYGPNKLQQAIDAASIFHNNDPKRRKAYVFVQGSTASQGNVIMREGVEVFGGLPKDYPYWAIPTKDDPDPERDKEWEYTDAEIEAFVNRVRGDRVGPATADANPSYINQINTVSALAHTHSSLIDGFCVTPESPETATAAPAVNIVVPNVTVRNCMITNFRMADSQSVVNISGRSDGKSLLYNTLVYNNKAGAGAPVVSVGQYGYVLNCTVVADGTDTPVGGTHNDNDHVQNTIAVSETAGSKAEMFAPYQRPQCNNGYEPAEHITSHRPYWYQLVETSSEIDAGQDNGTGPNGGNTIASSFSYVKFDLDRDLLGNPRRLGGIVDNGCYETWKITDDTRVTNLTNGKADADKNKFVTDITPDKYDITGLDPENDADEIEIRIALKEEYDNLKDGNKILDQRAEGYWAQNYGGNYYPHTGSVVYVMENKNLVFDTNDGAPLFKNRSTTAPNPIQPGYVLVKSGASIYGQGNALVFNYVAAERVFDSGIRYGLVSLPFDSRLDATSYLVKSGNPFAAYTYNAASRAVHNYEFRDADSDLWETLNMTEPRQRNAGWLLKFDSPLENEETLRFTGWSATAGTYVYEEVQDAEEKIVVLTQNDNRPGDGTAHFTRQEDMGWNLTGLPYLVSTYTTWEQEDGIYDMHIPHILYKMHTDGLYVKNNTTYAVKSWEDTENLALHEGFFLQTAAIGATEDLHFRRPVYSVTPPSPAPRPLVMLRNTAGEGDLMQLEPDENVDKRLDYMLGRDGIKWLLNDVPQMYLLSERKDTRISLAGAAPTETDMQVGLSLPSLTPSGNRLLFDLYTISLPEAEAYDSYTHVWLTDHLLHRVVDLKEQDYTFSVKPAEEADSDSDTKPFVDNSRFTLRIGGLPITNENGQRQYIIYTAESYLHVRGLIEGDRIDIFSAAGQHLSTAIATGNEYITYLPYRVGYVVKVNSQARTVVNL